MSKDLIIKTGKEYGLLRNQLAYVLATTEWETNKTFEPVREAYWLSEDWRKKNLRYYPWYGRGFVQITWEDNYKKAEQKLGVNLTRNPDDVMKPDISAKILVQGMKEGWFTGKKLSDFITLKKSDFKGARPIVNGDSSKKVDGKRIDDIIADLAKKYDRELLASGYGVEATEKPTGGSNDKVLDNPSSEGRTTLLSLLWKLIKLFLKLK